MSDYKLRRALDVRTEPEQRRRTRNRAIEIFRRASAGIKPCDFCGRVVLAGVCCQERLDHAAALAGEGKP